MECAVSACHVGVDLTLRRLAQKKLPVIMKNRLEPFPGTLITMYYLCQGGGHAIESVCPSFVLSVILYVCLQDYCKSNQPISSKLDVVIMPANRKN